MPDSLKDSCAFARLHTYRRNLSLVQEQTLQVGSEEVQIVSSSGTQSGSEFNAATFFAGLQTQTLGQHLLTAPLLSSTQNLVHDHFSRLPDGCICVADQQTSGKGTSPSIPIPFSLEPRDDNNRDIACGKVAMYIA